MRFNTDGAIDASFGNNGRVATNLTVGTGAAGNDIAYGVTIQSDGKIVVAGEAAGRFAVTRYLGDAVAAVNQPPVATDDSFTTDEDTPLTIAAVDLLSNDTDPNSDPLTITATTAPTNGTLVDNGDGTYTYTPNANFSGTDSFTYTISDGLGGNSIATVNLTINEVAEEIIGTPGNDILTGTEEPDIIRALAGNDIIQGLGGDDLIFGDEGDDRIDGGAGNDTMNGGAGNDTYTVDSTGDVVIETVGNGNNDLVRSSVSWTLGDNVESLTLLGTAPLNGTGNALNNRILGNSAANTLTGNDGNDTLDGKGGNDILLGGNGVDRIIGGAGNDQITSGARGDDLSGNAGQDLFIFVDAPIGSFDTIRDFTPTDDTLQISRSAFGLSLPLGTIPVSALALGTSASLASERFVYDQGSGNLFFDEDGVGGTTQVQIAKLTNRPTTFSNSDIVVIA
jgi:Ca2+-binding RTX toxin-like protein